MLITQLIKKIVLLQFVATLLLCQTKVEAQSVDPDDLSAINIITMPIAQGKFQQRKYFKILKQPIKSSGELYLEQGLGFLWQTNAPVFDQLLLKVDGFYHVDGVNPIKKMQGADVLAQVIMKAMLGNVNALADEFIIENQLSTQCIKLSPKDEGLSSIIAVIELCYSKMEAKTSQPNQPVKNKELKQRSEQKLEQIILREHSGNRTEIDVQLAQVKLLPEAIRAQLQ